jgi:biopolymer transport protein ExbD
MKRRYRRKSRWTSQPDINLNSFLDLILNVLLFFVFATELAVFEAMELAVPVTEYSETVSSQKRGMIINISKNNKFYADGKNFSMKELASLLNDKKIHDPTFSGVIVRGDLHSSLQSMVDVLSACRIAGIDKVKVETERPSE